jgi:hypothetical protein
VRIAMDRKATWIVAAMSAVGLVWTSVAPAALLAQRAPLATAMWADESEGPRGGAKPAAAVRKYSHSSVDGSVDAYLHRFSSDERESRLGSLPLRRAPAGDAGEARPTPQPPPTAESTGSTALWVIAGVGATVVLGIAIGAALWTFGGLRRRQRRKVPQVLMLGVGRPRGATARPTPPAPDHAKPRRAA